MGLLAGELRELSRLKASPLAVRAAVEATSSRRQKADSFSAMITGCCQLRARSLGFVSVCVCETASARYRLDNVLGQRGLGAARTIDTDNRQLFRGGRVNSLLRALNGARYCRLQPECMIEQSHSRRDPDDDSYFKKPMTSVGVPLACMHAAARSVSMYV